VEYYKKINRELDEKNKNISNKLIEVEGQFELSRNQQDKLRRNLEASIKEAADAKEKEKTVKKALKSKEQESLSFESEHATLKQKLKSIEQIYKLEVDKVRDDAEKLRIQYEN
jgi:chromosome segregation ATPase